MLYGALGVQRVHLGKRRNEGWGGQHASSDRKVVAVAEHSGRDDKQDGRSIERRAS